MECLRILQKPLAASAVALFDSGIEFGVAVLTLVCDQVAAMSNEPGIQSAAWKLLLSGGEGWV